MTVTEIIDQVIERSDNIKGSPADYLDRRLRLLDFLREVVDDLWWLRDWPWRMKDGTVTVPAGGTSVAVPADFSDWGHDGGLYGPDGEPLDPVTEREMIDLQEAGSHSDTPRCYSIFGIDDTGLAPTYRKLLQFPLTDTGASLRIHYDSIPPDLDEGLANGNLVRIPVQYHRRLIVLGVKAKSRESKGDARAPKTTGDYEAAKKSLLTVEARGRNQIRRLPSFFGGGR